MSSCTTITHAHIGISLFSSCFAVIWCFLYIFKGFSLLLRVLEFICGQPFHLFSLKLNEHFQCWNHFLRYGKFSSVITLRIAPPPTHLTYSLFSSWNWIRYIWNFQDYPPYLFLILSFFPISLWFFFFMCVCCTFGKLLSWILQLFKCLPSAIYSIFSKYLLSIKYVLGTILGMGIQQWANKVMALKKPNFCWWEQKNKQIYIKQQKVLWRKIVQRKDDERWNRKDGQGSSLGWGDLWEGN